MTPLVSIGIPVRNGERFIGATLESVLTQTIDDFAIVVSDNCSSDRTVDVVRSLGDERIRILRNDRDLGAIANWNLVAKAMEGRFVKLLPADDLLDERCLERQTAVLDAPGHENVLLACGQRDIIDEKGRVVLAGRGLAGMAGVVQAEDAVRRAARSGTNPFGEPAAVLCRGDRFRACLPLSARWPYLVDLELWCRIVSGGALYAMPETVAAFRVAATSESVNIAGEQAAQTRSFLRALRSGAVPSIGGTDYVAGACMATVNATARRLLYAGLRRNLFSLRRSPGHWPSGRNN